MCFYLSLISKQVAVHRARSIVPLTQGGLETKPSVQ
jgi:hypothetical protein